jgi:putative flippase GtrA
MFIGTGVGLVIKYLLDKRYIFRFQTQSAAQDGKLFVLYTCMGIATTAVFWATEWMFHVWFGSDFMRYVGACLGLTVGYITKYWLDKRYVFVSSQPNKIRYNQAK